MCISLDLGARLAKLEESLGLGGGKLNQEWTSLSGGERQRAIIACALLSAESHNQTG